MGADGAVVDLTTRREWDAARARDSYRPARYEADGFIHCSRLEQVERVARARYRPTPDLLVLAIDAAGLDVRDEVGDPGSDEVFPPVYGELPVSAVVEVLPSP